MATIAGTTTLIRLLTKTTTTSFTNAQVLVVANESYERITGVILSETAAASWKYGDINYTALPTYTMNLVNSQAEYQIDSLTGPLIILGVEILDNNGIWYPIRPIDLDYIHNELGLGQVEHLKTDGAPIQYEKIEHMVRLYPAPDNGVSVTLTGGLKIHFLRGASVFTDMTASTDPGLPSPWHSAIAWDSAYTYAVANNLPNLNHLKEGREARVKELLAFISRRDQDDKKVMRPRKTRYI